MFKQRIIQRGSSSPAAVPANSGMSKCSITGEKAATLRDKLHPFATLFSLVQYSGSFLIYFIYFIYKFSQKAMNLETEIGMQAIDPKAYLTGHLQRGLRLDGREPLEMRPLSCKVLSRGDGSSGLISVCVGLGGTIVTCSVSVLIGTPSYHTPDCGDLLFDMKILESRLESRNKTHEELEVERVLQRLLEKRLLLTDMEQLCVATNKAAFRLALHFHCLQNEGNVLDTAIHAAVYFFCLLIFFINHQLVFVFFFLLYFFLFFFFLYRTSSSFTS